MASAVISPVNVKAESFITFGQNYTTTFTNTVDQSFSFSTDENGYVAFTIDKPILEDGKGATVFVEILDTNGICVWRGVNGEAQKSDASTSYFYKVGLNAGTYLCKFGPSSLGNAKPTVNYRLDFVADAFFETECNNTNESADVLSLDCMYSGVAFDEDSTSYYSGMCDVFAVSLQKGHGYRIVMENFDNLFANRPQFVVTNPSGNSSNIGSKFDGDTSTKTFEFIAASTGVYYFEFGQMSDTGGKEYKIGVFDLTPKAPTLTSVKKGKKSFTVKYTQTENTAGYEICYSLKKNFKSSKKANVSSATTLNKKVKKLTSKKKYYVRVRSYNIVASTKVYGPWSNKKNVKVN